MSCGSRYNISSHECNHSETVISLEDEEVCLHCGLVIDKLYTDIKTETKNIIFFKKEIKEQNNNKILNFILDICENIHIQRNVSLSAFERYKTFKGQIVKKVTDENLAIYSIYETLKDYEIPRTADEIAYFANVDKSKLWSIQSCIRGKKKISNPQQYTERFTKQLGLDFYDNQTVLMLVNKLSLEIGNVKSSCLIALSIYLYNKHNCYSSKLNKMTLKYICQVCSISTTSVHRLLRSINRDSLSNINKYICKNKCEVVFKMRKIKK
jgi:hypothetical protein